jgi:hypothetical protein
MSRSNIFVGVRDTKLSPICLLRGSFWVFVYIYGYISIGLICLERKILMKTCFGDGTSLDQNVGYGVLWVFVRIHFVVWRTIREILGVRVKGGHFFVFTVGFFLLRPVQNGCSWVFVNITPQSVGVRIDDFYPIS